MFIDMSVSLGVGASGVHKPACVYVACACLGCNSVRVAGVRACVSERGVLSTAVVGWWSQATAIDSSKFMLPHDPRYRAAGTH